MAEKKTKIKQPGAQKRHAQAGRRYLRNKAFKSRVKTSIRTWSDTVKSSADMAKKEEALKDVYSFLDKAAKKGLYHKNKTARLKSRITAKSPSSTP